MRSFSDFDTPELEALVVAWGYKPVHAGRLLRAYYEGRGEIDFDAIETPLALRQKLAGEITSFRSQLSKSHQSPDGTVKLLLTLDSGGAVETVLMPTYRSDRAAGCVSSQIGCAMGCDFCASTKSGLERNLEAGEIVEQYVYLQQRARQMGRKLQTLVFMGMGEPMHNLDNVIAAIKRIADPDLGGLGWRQITVSTVGIVPGMDKLAEADLNVHLAVSLHAADDETRLKLIPMNKRYPVAEVMAAARRFEKRTRRTPTIEWCFLEGINDSDVQANKLADLMEGFRAHVNLIPYNPIGVGLSGVEYRRPSQERMDRFSQILWDRKVVAHFRTTRGDSIAAACGQLRQTSM